MNGGSERHGYERCAGWREGNKIKAKYRIIFFIKYCVSRPYFL